MHFVIRHSGRVLLTKHEGCVPSSVHYLHIFDL